MPASCFDAGDARGFHLFDGLGADAGERSKRSRRRGEPGHLVFDLAALFFFALDVDIPADQLAGQAHVLAFFADGQRKLRIFDNHFQLVRFGIGNLHARNFRGAQRLLRERDGFFAVTE